MKSKHLTWLGYISKSPLSKGFKLFQILYAVKNYKKNKKIPSTLNGIHDNFCVNKQDVTVIQ